MKEALSEVLQFLKIPVALTTDQLASTMVDISGDISADLNDTFFQNKVDAAFPKVRCMYNAYAITYYLLKSVSMHAFSLNRKPSGSYVVLIHPYQSILATF